MKPDTTAQAQHSDAKYPFLVEQLAAKIRNGELRVGERLPTFIELQQGFEVSMQTVNRAMIVLEQQGLIERRRGSGVYVAEQVSKKPETRRRHGIIGLCGSAFWGSASSYYWTHVAEGVRVQAEAAGSQILLLPYQVNNGWEKVDGVLTADLLNASHRRSIPAQLPIVSLFGLRQSWAGVMADEYSGMKEATQHLLALGHRQVAYLHGFDRKIVSRRLKGYEDALRDAGIAPQKEWLRLLSRKIDSAPQFTLSGRTSMAAWFQDKGPSGWQQTACTALLCHNDDTAIGAMQAFNEAGLKVPDDVSVIGFDGTEVAEYSLPSLTSVEMPLRRMGEIAISLLQKQIEADEVIVEHKVLPTHLRVRESTSAPSPDFRI